MRTFLRKRKTGLQFFVPPGNKGFDDPLSGYNFLDAVIKLISGS